MDLQGFWADNEESLGKPFSTDKPRAAVVVAVDDHWLLGEMRVESTVRYYRDAGYRAEVNRACNRRTLARLGRAFFPDDVFPSPPRRIEEVFGSELVLTEGSTPWLESRVESIADLKAILRKVERMGHEELEGFVFPEEFHAAEADWRARGGEPLRLGATIRGPVTVGTSVCGTMNYLHFVLDYPDVMDDFVRLLATRSAEYLKLLRARTGADAHGLRILDDNCCLLSPGLYERFGYPVLRALFDELSPNPSAVGGDIRYQHSDSAMGHLLPFFRDLRMTGLNLGPTIHPKTIRDAVPSAVIYGQVPPETLARGKRDEIRAAVRRDVEAVGGDGGLVLTTAGSVREGTSLDSILLFLEAVDELSTGRRPAPPS